MRRRIEIEVFKKHVDVTLNMLDSEGILLTKKGRPIARLVPAEDSGIPLIGGFASKATFEELGSCGKRSAEKEPILRPLLTSSSSPPPA